MWKTTGDHKYSQPGLYTPTIEEVNRRLAQFAKDSDGCIHYIPCKSCFLKKDGTGIIPELMRDALHPTGKGMRAWFQARFKSSLLQICGWRFAAWLLLSVWWGGDSSL